jgi:hypothetical protein
MDSKRYYKQCCRRQRYLLRKCRLSPDQRDEEYLRKYSKRLKNIINLTQKSQNNYLIKNAQNKSKATWKIINSSKSNHPRHYISEIFSHNNIQITNPKYIAQEFNNHFIDQIQPINIVNNNSNSINSNIYLNNNLTFNSLNSIFMQPTTSDDILKIINGLRNTNSTGFDGISTYIVKKVSHIISPLLSHIVNLCIICGRFPEKLKLTIIKPLHKKHSKEDMNNYRPIALIPIFSKIIEKYIYNSVSGYFEHNNLFVNEQKGFRKNMTINMAIFDLVETVLKNMDKRIPVSALYMDMSKAFDYVDHRILLEKLYRYGIRGNIHSLLQSYLSNRRQTTQISKICFKTKTEQIYSSDLREIRYGVPQGSVLGPLLFLIYINDMPNIIDHPMVLFADDSTIIFSGKNLLSYEDDINKTLNTIIKWLTKNNLKINLSKTKLMTFQQRTNYVPNLTIAYKGLKIENTDITKFLGLNVDDKLTWKYQIDSISKKLNQFSYALYNLRKKVNPAAVLTAYHAFVTSTLRYGIIFWGNSTDREIAFRAQKRCLRSLCGISSLESCKPHFHRLKILTLASLYIYEMCVFVKCNSHLYLNFKSTRLQHKIKNPMIPKTMLFQKNVVGMAPKIFNKLPKCLISIDQLHIFKKTLKNVLAHTSYYTINEYINDSDFDMHAQQFVSRKAPHSETDQIL